MTALADAGFLVALLRRRDNHHEWAVAQAAAHPRPWLTCEAALAEAFHLLGAQGTAGLEALLRRDAVQASFSFPDNRGAVVDLMRKYADLPMSLADACLVRMTELLPDPVVVTTDRDFRVYRRHGRRIVPCVMPG